MAESADAAAIPRLLRQASHCPFQTINGQRKHAFADQLFNHLDRRRVGPVRFR